MRITSTHSLRRFRGKKYELGNGCSIKFGFQPEVCFADEEHKLKSGDSAGTEIEPEPDVEITKRWMAVLP